MAGAGVLIVSGAPGAGKTTVARLLAARFGLAAHIEATRSRTRSSPAACTPRSSPPRRQHRLRTTNVSLLADSFAAAGIMPVIDDTVVERRRLGDYLDDLATRPVRLVVLAPPAAVAHARDAARPHKQVGHIWGHLDAVMRAELTGTGRWIDSGERMAEQTAAAVIDLLGGATVSDSTLVGLRSRPR